MSRLGQHVLLISMWPEGRLKHSFKASAPQVWIGLEGHRGSVSRLMTGISGVIMWLAGVIIINLITKSA